jgi:hypothetical protein
MRLLAILLLLVLSGCQSLIPAQRKFPEAPTVLMDPCPQLKKMPEDSTSLKDMLGVVIENYSTYYQCSNKTQSWQEWYIRQKEVFEKVK